MKIRTMWQGVTVEETLGIVSLAGDDAEELWRQAEESPLWHDWPPTEP